MEKCFVNLSVEKLENGKANTNIEAVGNALDVGMFLSELFIEVIRQMNADFDVPYGTVVLMYVADRFGYSLKKKEEEPHGQA